MENTNIDKINEIRETATSLREDLENMGLAVNGFFNYLDDKLNDIESGYKPKEMTVRFTWRMEAYISGRDLADIKEKWDDFDIRSDCAEYVETTSIENADTNDDIDQLDFEAIHSVADYAEDIEIGEYEDTTAEYHSIKEFSDDQMKVFKNTLHDRGMECSYNKTFDQYEITERRY